MEWWQTLPLRIDPVAFRISFLFVYWYGLLLLIGIAVSFWALLRTEKKAEKAFFSRAQIESLFFWALFGAFIGGKIGYIGVYAGREFMARPELFLIPYNFDEGMWTGLAGMSYHGALLGALLSLWIWSRQVKGESEERRYIFWQAADRIALFAPILTFFGRLGNFSAGELYGRVTEKGWGMYFHGVLPVGGLRHPSALYEALLEGLMLGLAVFWLRKRGVAPGKLICFYMAAYAVIRFFLEFFREPDIQRALYFQYFSIGQILSVLLLILAVAGWRRLRKHAIVIQH